MTEALEPAGWTIYGTRCECPCHYTPGIRHFMACCGSEKRDTPTTDPSTIASRLSEAQRKLVMASEPGGWGRDDCACGVEIRGPQYRAAKELARPGLGSYTHGSPYGDLYFNTSLGLAVRVLISED